MTTRAASSTINYESIAARNRRKYGTEVETYGKVLLSGLYSERTHFVYELLQNADDARASRIRFSLFPNRLEVRHNGRPFNQKDVEGICGLVAGTKSGDLTKIGRFGIGFKSVFAYTERPEIHCGGEHFCIEHYVLPFAVPAREIEAGETLFVFPFKHRDVRAQMAFAEISRHLEATSLETILFVQHLNTMEWSIDKSEVVSLVRRRRPFGDWHIVHLVRTQGDVEKRSSWVMFERRVNAKTTQDKLKLKVELAYRLEDGSRTGEARIVPVLGSTLSVFFPTEKETHLGFHVQGPYRTTPARDNVPEDDGWNRHLVVETARLVVESLEILRRKNILRLSTLSVMPLKRESFPPGHMFRPVFEQVREALARRPLLPAGSNRFVRGQAAVLTADPRLRGLFDGTQLQKLFQADHKLVWLDKDERLSDDGTALFTYLREDLKVRVLDVDAVLRHLTVSFLEEQSDEWLARYYLFLDEHAVEWKRRHYYSTSRPPLLQLAFLRLENGQHVIPLDENHKPNAYLPPEEDVDFPLVKRTVVEMDGVRKFLMTIGLREPDVVEVVLRKILPRYKAGERYSLDEQYVQDLRLILKAISAGGPRQQEIISRLRATYFLAAVSPTGQSYVTRPDSAYIRAPVLEIYFDGNEKSKFLREDLVPVSPVWRQLGVSDNVRVTRKAPDGKGYVKIRSSWGWHERGRSGFDPDASIDGLEHALGSITMEKAAVIWNELLIPNSNLIEGVVESSTRQSFEDLTAETKVSKLGTMLRAEAWLPDTTGKFHRPHDLCLQDLPEAFHRDRELGDLLGMKPDELAAVARHTGIPPDILEWTLRNQNKIRNMMKADQNAERDPNDTYQSPVYHEELERMFERSAHHHDDAEQQTAQGQVGNPEVRRERVRENITSARASEPRTSERFRTVPARQWERKDNAVRQFLNEQYNGNCQVCGDGFKKLNGEPYFEGLYLVPHSLARWFNRPGNVLCLCASCCAKIQHGPLEVETPIRDQILGIRLEREGGAPSPALRLRLCGSDKTISFTEKHILDLQELIKASLEDD